MPLSKIYQQEDINIICKIESALDRVLKSSCYTKDNLLCFSISLQPHFVVCSSALALHPKTEGYLKEISIENAREELFGLANEGCHALLSHLFFQQLGHIKIEHHKKTKDEISQIYIYLNNPLVMLTFLTCTEMWSAKAKPIIWEAMKKYDVQNFYYIDIHKAADNIEDGHSVKFLRALEKENPSYLDVVNGIQLFEQLFTKIFS